MIGSYDDTFSGLEHLRADGLRPVAILSLSVLRSLNADKLEALGRLGITTLSELLHYEPVHRARVVMAAARGEIGHEINLSAYLDGPLATLAGIESQGPAVILGIGDSQATILLSDFGIATVADLADFEPFREAEKLVTEQSATFFEAASAPDELIPRYRGAAPATRVRYSSFVREDTVRPGLRLSMTPDAPSYIDKSLAALFLRFDQDGESPNTNTPFNPNLGFALLHEQSWIPIGLQLGEPMHSVGLSPGEVRKVAIIDWRQSLRGSRVEGTETIEQLNSLLTHQRALDEVVRTTAEEHQAGRTDTISATGLGAGAGVASGALVGAIGGAVAGGLTGGVAGVPLGTLLGLLGGGATGAAAAAPTGEVAAPVTVPGGAIVGTPAGAGLGGLGGTLTGSVIGSVLGSLSGSAAAAIAGSLLGSASGAIGHIESTSNGNRKIFGRLNQNIMDVATQKSSNIRSLRSTVVIDVSQAEQENLTTYTIANNNRAHALTVIYFELLNKYAVETRTTRVDPLIYVPINPLKFDLELMAKYWHVLRLGITDAALVSAIDGMLSSTDFYSGSLTERVSEREEAKITGITVSLIVGWSASNPAGFHCSLETINSGSINIPYRDKSSISTGGITFFFTNNSLSIPNTEGVDGIKITVDGTFGVDVTVSVNELRIDPGDGQLVFRDISLGSHKFDAGTDQYHVFPFNAWGQIGDREEAQRSEQLVVDRTVNLLNRRSYFFTRFLLSGIDPAEFEDLIEALELGVQDSFSVRLSSLIDPRPVGFVGGSIVFRLKRNPDLDSLEQATPENLKETPLGRFNWVVPRASSDLPEAANSLVQMRSRLMAALAPYLNYINEIEQREQEERDTAAVRREITLPTSGVFAEAILGRSNAAEIIDATRYIAWDLPNPNAAPDIAALQAGGRGQTVDVNLSPTVTDGVLNLQTPTSLPDPTGFAQAFGALSNANLFRDMSKSDHLANTLSKLADVALAGANRAADLAGNAQASAFDAANNLATKVADNVAKVNDTAGSLTDLGAKMNAGLPTIPGSGGTSTTPSGSGSNGGGATQGRPGDSNGGDNQDFSDGAVIETTVGSYMTTPEYQICKRYAGCIATLLGNYFSRSVLAIDQFETKMNFATSDEAVPKLGSAVVHYMVREGIDHAVDMLPTPFKKVTSVIRGAMESVNAEIKRAEEAASEFEVGSFIREMRRTVDEILTAATLATLSLPDKLYELYNDIYIDNIVEAREFLANMQNQSNGELAEKWLEEDSGLLRKLELSLYERFLEAIYRKSEWDNDNIPYPARSGLVEINHHVQDGLEYVKVVSPFRKNVAEGLTQTMEKDGNNRIDLNRLKCHKWVQVRSNEWDHPLYHGWVLVDHQGRKGGSGGRDAWSVLNETLPSVEKIDG